MKTKNFFAGHSSGGRAERFKKMGNKSFKNLFGKKTMIFITLLTLFLGFTTNAWAYKISAGTMFYDNSITQWSNVNIQIKGNSDGALKVWNEYAFTQITGTDFWYLNFGSDYNNYDGFYLYETSWNNNSTYQKQDVAANSVFVVKEKGKDKAVGYFTTYKKAYPNITLYFDNSESSDGWGDNIYLRYGFDCVNHADKFTKFPGTTNLFYLEVKEAYYEKYTVSNNAGWTGANKVEQPWNDNGIKPESPWNITKELNYSNTDINNSTTHVVSFTNISYTKEENGCDFYNYSVGSSIPQHTVTIKKVSHGTITASYYGTDGNQYNSESKTNEDHVIYVPRTGQVKITLTTDNGYSGTLTVGGSAFTSGNTYTVTSDITISANVTENLSTITLAVTPNASGTLTIEGATATSTTAGVTTNRIITAVPATGYKFKSWSLTGNATKVSESDNVYTVKGDGTKNGTATLTATFERNLVYHKVTFGSNVDKGTVTATADGAPYTSGDNALENSTIEITATPSTGYRVAGWYDNQACTGTVLKTETGEGVKTYTIAQLTADKTVYAKFVEIDYTITLSKGTGISDIKVGGTSQNSVTAHVDTKTDNITAVLSTGYSWNEWTITSGSITATPDLRTNGIQINATSTGTLKATATEILHSVTMVSSDDNKGTAAITSDNQTAGIATAITITATPEAGYYFTGWEASDPSKVTFGNASSASTTANVTADDITIIANFAERWVLRGSRSDGSGDEGMPGTSTTTDVFTFAADATTGTKTVTLLPNRDYKYKIYDIKGNTERGQQNSGNYQPGNKEWKLDGSSDVLFHATGYGTYTFTLVEEAVNNVTYPKITFTKPLSHQITMAAKAFTNGVVSTDESNGGTITAQTKEMIGDEETYFDVVDGDSVRRDGSVTFTATPKTGYTFVGFYSNEACTSELQAASSGTTYTISNIQENKAVYAKFTENLTPVTLKINGDGTVKVGDVEKSDGTVFSVGVYTTVTFTTVNGSSTKFNGWTTSTGADFTMEGNTLKGNGAGRTDGQILTANFGELDKIYFYNIANQGSDNFTQWNTGKVFVYFGVSWDKDDKGVAPQGCHCREMSRIDGTDIYWANIETQFNTGAIAFSDVNMSTNENFHGNRAAYRTDYNSKLNMYVPRVSESKNTTDYSSNGYWMKYDPEVSEGVGYYLKRQIDDHQYGEFQATADGSHTSFITISVDANTQQKLYIVSAGAQNYGADAFDKDHKQHNIYKYEKDWQFTFTPNGTGDYTFKLTQGEGTLMSLEIDYPNTDNAYRVVYNNGTKDHPSHAIQPDDKVSFFVNKGGKFRIQQFTDGTWTDKVTNISVPSDITSDGVYIFQLAGDGKSLSNLGAYTGNYYIRTDRAGGGWHNYKGNENNLMVKGNIYGYNNTYDYAYTQWCPQNTNVKYTIANDYSLCISDSLAGDDVIGTDKQFLTSEGANIRFMWNSKTNALKRDYIGGSNNEHFLYIHGGNAETGSTASKLYLTKETASPVAGASFHDDGNWIYSKEFYVEPGAYIALTAKFNDKYQFFYGEGDASTGAITKYKSFVGGESGDKLRMQVIYNFKTNELVAGYIPDGGTISTTIDLNSDLLWIRTQQGEATPINFSGTDISINNINKIYGVLELCKDSMTNLYVGDVYQPLTTSSYDHINYWISFPFDVKISEIFGVDGYGEKWVIQYYNGEKRAEIGWFAETSTFWEWLDIDDVMYAGKGYTLNLNTTYFDEATDDVWKNVESKVAFYFPSTETKIGVIKQQEVTTKIPDHAYQYDRYFGDGNKKNHRETDSYWNIIGTPAFQKTTISTASGTQGPKAIYVWKQGKDGSNGYDIKTTITDKFTFQPMRSYIVQYGGEVTWNTVSSIVKATAPYAYADQKNYLIDLEFYFGEQRDHTYINLSDNATKEFKLNEDVMKMTNSKEPNIYSYAEGYDVAYNEVPMVNQTINLGVIARKNGSYTFSMPKDFSGSAILVDLEEGTFTDLNVSNYSVDLNKGTYNNRFQLMLEVEAKIPTNIENANGGLWSEDGKTQKLLINDNIYLINGGRVYNATGTMVR